MLCPCRVRKVRRHASTLTMTKALSSSDASVSSKAGAGKGGICTACTHRPSRGLTQTTRRQCSHVQWPGAPRKRGAVTVLCNRGWPCGGTTTPCAHRGASGATLGVPNYGAPEERSSSRTQTIADIGLLICANACVTDIVSNGGIDLARIIAKAWHGTLRGTTPKYWHLPSWMVCSFGFLCRTACSIL